MAGRLSPSCSKRLENMSYVSPHIVTMWELGGACIVKKKIFNW